MFKNDVYQACYWNLNIGDKNTRVIEANAEGTELISLNPIAKIFTIFSAAQNKQYVHVDYTDEHIYIYVWFWSKRRRNWITNFIYFK
jgi:hypothetical protein